MSTGNFTYSGDELSAHNGYAIKFGDGGDNPSLRITKIVNGTDLSISLGTVENGWGAWYHFDVTRTADGEINVWVDDVHKMSMTDTTFNISTNLVVELAVWEGFDNVSVSDTIDFTVPVTTTEPSTTTTTTTTTTPTTTTTTPEPSTTTEPPTTTETTTEPAPQVFDMTTILIIGGGAVALIVVIALVAKTRS